MKGYFSANEDSPRRKFSSEGKGRLASCRWNFAGGKWLRGLSLGGGNSYPYRDVAEEKKK